jgi:hypothetical protein
VKSKAFTSFDSLTNFLIISPPIVIGVICD